MKVEIRMAIDLEPGDKLQSDASGTQAVLAAFAKAANIRAEEATELWRAAKQQARQGQLAFKSPARTRRAREAKEKS